ncbi:MAG: SpoIID/LytB domain-containing protein [Bacteroidales bacterium]|nr:SpoIID/LytB domain-containing protein [Bacteroidales bacterium]MCM1416212.1 SpoIID/LytB domain-containing protein [bacterium]MCM1424224.1 SpoIID/LytB domain-containing protein [bacterium]
MKNNGIVSKKSNRRDALSFLLFVFLLPYVCACLWGHAGEETAKLRKEAEAQDGRMVEAALSWGMWELPAEEYLTYLLALLMPEESDPEVLKAQAVLLRTELAARYQEQETETLFSKAEELAQFYGGAGNEEELAAYRQAVGATTGIILTDRGEPVRASFMRLTGEGKTWKEILFDSFSGTELANFE